MEQTLLHFFQVFHGLNQSVGSEDPNLGQKVRPGVGWIMESVR